jgi:hypothetical protein
MSLFVEQAEIASHRSELGRWLAANHDEFWSMLRTHRPRWEALTELMVQQKLLQVDEGFWSDDPAISAPIRKKAIRTAQRAWDRVHAKALKSRTVKPTAPALGRPSDDGQQAMVRMLDEPLPALPDPATPRPPQPRLVLRPATPLGSGDLPQDDGSKLPKPFPRTRT